MRITVTDPSLLPIRATEGAAGFDLKAAEYVFIPAGSHAVVPTGVSVEIPENHVGLIFSRSGLANKFGIQTHLGVIDSDYRGEIGVILFNHGAQSSTAARGERIAQLLLMPVHTPILKQVEALTTTQRGTGGFGSTGR